MLTRYKNDHFGYFTPGVKPLFTWPMQSC